MPAVTQSFITSVEQRMRTVTTGDFERVNKRRWWDKVAKVVTTKAKSERISWLLDSAKITRPNAARGGGQAMFNDIAEQSTTLESEFAGDALEIKRSDFEDVDQNGVDGGQGYKLAFHWSKQMGAQSAYWPQKQVAKLLKDNPTGYDGVALFHGTHPVNPYDTAAGTFANVFTGSASGSYPGALPIGDTVTVDVALSNLNKALAYIGTIMTPNGEDPRNLRIAGIMGPPRMAARLVQLTSAKFITQAGGSSSSLSADVEAVIKSMALGEPVIAPELSAAYGGSDTSAYLIVEDILSDELGGVIYLEREPFKIYYNDHMTDAQLARAQKLQWLSEGRNAAEPGHPYLIFRLDAT